MISLWEYLRRRVSNSVLAGFHDAMNVIERADVPDSDYESADRLRQRFRNAVLVVTNKAVAQNSQNQNQNPIPDERGKHPSAVPQPKQTTPPVGPTRISPLPTQMTLPLPPKRPQGEFQPQQSSAPQDQGSRRRGRPPKHDSRPEDQP